MRPLKLSTPPGPVLTALGATSYYDCAARPRAGAHRRPFLPQTLHDTRFYYFAFTYRYLFGGRRAGRTSCVRDLNGKG